MINIQTSMINTIDVELFNTDLWKSRTKHPPKWKFDSNEIEEIFFCSLDKLMNFHREKSWNNIWRRFSKTKEQSTIANWRCYKATSSLPILKGSTLINWLRISTTNKNKNKDKDKGSPHLRPFDAWIAPFGTTPLMRIA